METTDTPMSDEQAAEALLAPIETETEAETAEAPQEETEAEETETEGDASEAADENDSDADDGEEPDDADDDDDEGDSEEEQPAQLYAVKVDGEERQVTLEELQRGFSGQAYIQKGMETNKAQERALVEKAQTLQQQTDYVLQLYNQAQSSGFTPPPQAPDPELAKTDFVAYVEAKAEYDAAADKFQAEQQQLQFIQEQKQAQQADQLRQHMAQQEQQLLREMPELSDPENAQKFKKTLQKAREEYGFSEDDMRQIVTHLPSVKALYDAARYRDLQANKETAKAPREAPKTVTKPKAKVRDGGKAKRAKEMKQKARQSQTTDDWAEVLFTP